MTAPERVEQLQEPDGRKGVFHHHPRADQRRRALQVTAAVAQQTPEPVAVITDVILDEGALGDLPQQNVE